MKFILPKVLAAAVAVAPVLSLPLLGGCEEEHGHAHGWNYPAGDTYVYTPGYYYDKEYYDPAGHFHDRHYYYYDGHNWSNRDAVPSGYTAQERHERHEAHAEHREHEEHHDQDVD
jgi:hypothetical protein